MGKFHCLKKAEPKPPKPHIIQLLNKPHKPHKGSLMRKFHVS